MLGQFILQRDGHAHIQGHALGLQVQLIGSSEGRAALGEGEGEISRQGGDLQEAPGTFCAVFTHNDRTLLRLQELGEVFPRAGRLLANQNYHRSGIGQIRFR